MISPHVLRADVTAVRLYALVGALDLFKTIYFPRRRTGIKIFFLHFISCYYYDQYYNHRLVRSLPGRHLFRDKRLGARLHGILEARGGRGRRDGDARTVAHRDDGRAL